MLIVDTDILIDAGRNDSHAIGFLERAESEFGIAISAITQMELLVGARDKLAQRSVERFLARFTLIKLSDGISDTAYALLVRYRLSHGLEIADALIAATALVTTRPFATKNVRDYRFIKELTLHSYP